MDQAIERRAAVLRERRYPVDEAARLMQGAVATADEAVSGAIHDELGRVEEQRQRGAGSDGPSPATSSPMPAPARRARVPKVIGAEVHRLTEQFNAYGNDNTSAETWTGADSTYSVVLPDGRVLWIFSDTFLGIVHPDGSRPKHTSHGGTTPMLNNAFVIQDGDRFQTVLGEDGSGQPKAIMTGREYGYLGATYWAGGAQVHDGQVEMVMRRYFQMVPEGAVVAVFDPGDLSRPQEVVELPWSPGVSWGSATTRTDEHTYVYGAEDTGAAKHLRIARVEGQSLRGRWEYLTADGGWSASEADAANQLAGVGNEFSVTPMGDAYLLVTHDTTEVMSADIVGYAAPTPYGPFEDKKVLYTTPETGAHGSYGNPNIYTYNSMAHPHIADGNDRLLLSYNVQVVEERGGPPWDFDVYRDVSIYRPRFVTVQFDDAVLG